MKAKKKRGVDAPVSVRAFISSVINTPLEDIDIPLARFSWEYEKGDFYHWIDLLNYFECFFEKYVKPRKDLQLDGNSLEDGYTLPTFPKKPVLQILRVTRIVLENCMNKYLYNSNEHISVLFSSGDPEIVVAALETLAAFVKKPLQSNRVMRWHGDASLNARLFSLSQGWGGKEEGLGLLACATDNGCDAEACRLGSTLHFEFYADGKFQSNEEVKGARNTVGLQVIHLPDVHLKSEDDIQLFKLLNDQYNVPPSLRFSLLTRIRFARAFAFLTSRRQFTRIRLLAFTALLQSNPDHEDLTAFFVNEPEFVNELVTILCFEHSVPEDIRILAVLALTAQSQDRPRQSNVLNVISAGGHRGILPSLMQKAISSVSSSTFHCTVAFVESLLSLVTVLVSSSSGCSALREAGLIPTLLPLLKDMDPRHIHLVSAAVHILEAFMDYSNPAGTLFRDLGGLDDAIARLQVEVSCVEVLAKQQLELYSDSKGKGLVIEDGTLSQPPSVQSEIVVPHRQRLLLKALLRAIALGTYAPGNTIRLHGSEDSALPACLCTIFRLSREFGGGVFSLAASVMSDLIHKDPSCFSSLDSSGVPMAFLDAITKGVIPSSEAVGCIPNSLDALCLNNVGLQAVKDRNALGCFVKIFTSKMYLRALANDTPGSLASGLDELMRHAPTLRGPGIDMCIEILKTILMMGVVVEGSTSTPLQATGNSEAPVPMDTDLEDKSRVVAMTDVSQAVASQLIHEDAGEGSSANVGLFLPECINNVVRLLETILQNLDSSRVFIEKKGIEALLRLYTLRDLPVSFGGSSTAHNMSVTFRAFSPQHSSLLTQAVCFALRNHLKCTRKMLDEMGGARLLDLENGIRDRVVGCLSAAECFISLSAVLVRSSTSMMLELSSGGAEVLNDVGKVHREVLWQIVLFDDVKVDDPKNEKEIDGSVSGITMTSTTSRENEDDSDVYSVIRYINPVPSRNGPASHWGVERDFLPVLHSGGDGLQRRRREYGVTTEAVTQVGRLGRLSRYNVDPGQVDLESPNSPFDSPLMQDYTKRKSADGGIHEMLTRLVLASRGLYVALGKAIVIPSTRRRDDSVNISGPAKLVASALGKLLGDVVAFTGHSHSLQCESPVAVKCRYLGKVVEDINVVVFDNRRRTCNNMLVNSLYAHGAIKELLLTFQATSQLLWRVPMVSGSPMEMENGKLEGGKLDDKPEKANSWLLDTLKNYTRLLNNLVTSSLLLTPSSLAHLLVQPVVGGSEPIPEDPEAFIRALQTDVLEVILPVWSHPMFPQCSTSLITSVAAIITDIYTGIGDVKDQKSAASGSTGARHIGSPPDELSISRLVEMGFSRSRAEEALRQVEVNSVEIATEWLCSHPEGSPQEDVELARALAISMGSADSYLEGDASDKGMKGLVEPGGPLVPPIEVMLSTCTKVLQKTDAVAFPITDLLVTICNRNHGHDRHTVVSYLVHLLRQSKSEEAPYYSSSLSVVSHTLALLLSEDNAARKIAAEIGLVNIALEILISFLPSDEELGSRCEVPKWTTALLLVLCHMLQPKINLGTPTTVISKAATGSSAANQSGPILDVHDSKIEVVQKGHDESPLVAILDKFTGYMTDDEQRKAMSVCCNFLQMQLSGFAIQAVLQLCARLTKMHSIALQFLEEKGLAGLLVLPVTSLFPGFEAVAAAVIRHTLEDPQTLHQAMESEIRHTLVSTLARHNGRVSPRMFLTAMAPVISRDPVIFMQAVGCLCQVEMVGGRPSIILAKEKERERERDKDKEKEKVREKDRGKIVCPGDFGVLDGGTRANEASGKMVKGHKKVPHSFSQVIDQLLEVILHYPPPPDNDELSVKGSCVTAMEVDYLPNKEKGKAKLSYLTVVESGALSGNSLALSKVSFILKLTTEVLLMYSSAVSVVLRRDAESSQGRGPTQGGFEVMGHGGLIYHVLHRLLPYPGERGPEKINDEEWREKLSDRAAYFLMAVCVRSAEGRRRVVVEIARALSLAAKYVNSGHVTDEKVPNRKVRVIIDLVNSILLSYSSSGNSHTPGCSPDMSKAMMDVGMVQVLSQILQAIDLDHPDAPKLVNAVLKAMEVLTRVGSDEIPCDYACDKQKMGVSSERTDDQRIHRDTGLSFSETPSQGDAPARSRDETMHDTRQVELQRFDGILLPLSGAEEDSMEHDMRTDRQVGEAGPLDVDVEEEFMREAAEDAAELEDAAAEMAYRMEHGPDDDVVDDEDEEDMDGEDGDEEEEEEDDEEEDEDDSHGEGGVPRLSPPDTDVDDHDDNRLTEDYEDDMLEEEDGDEDWRADRVIEVRWRDGLTGLNHVQVLGQTGTANLVDFSGDPFQGMNVDDVFGNFRRSGGSDRRRAAAFRALPERLAGDRGGGFHHPLLTRPSLTPGTGITGPLVASNSWPTGGSFARDAEAILAGGGLDVAHFYMYDSPMLQGHAGDSLFGERGAVVPPPPLLDFSIDPAYVMGRRGGRSDSRLSSWTDDGQPQAGAFAAAVAVAIEEHFVSQLQSLVLSGNRAEVGSFIVPGPGVTKTMQPDALAGLDPDKPEPRDHGEPDGLRRVLTGNTIEHQDRILELETEGVESEPVVPSISEVPSCVEQMQQFAESETAASIDLDVQMQDERSEPVAHDIEAGSQDSEQSGATMGDSLRSLEVEIGSVDGCDADERQSYPRRDYLGGLPRTACSDAVPELLVRGTRPGGGPDEDMGGTGRTVQQTDQVRSIEGSDAPSTLDGQAASAPVTDVNAEEEEGSNLNSSIVHSIDPTFLEALPEDLRAEVMASQQAQTGPGASNHPPPAEDIDPEFLAALPPEIQAEVLAQQRAQRLAHARHLEGQPVDMDSASIIATFPAELREEVLLTSSEAILAVLPPALRAEAQLLRERAINQYQARGLFGGHRISSRRNTMGVGIGGGPTTIDRSVVNGTGMLLMGQKKVPLSGSQLKEVEGKPIVDTDGLKAMLRLLRLAQPLGKGLLQRLLLNLCAHSVTQITLLQLLLDMLRPGFQNITSISSSSNAASSQRLYGCQWNVVYARSQFSDGVPPLVSRRVLEILTYMARSHSPVASLLLYLEPLKPPPMTASTLSLRKPDSSKNEKGKEKVFDGLAEAEKPPVVKPEGEVPLILLLKLLNQPLYSRSSAHLEQVMGLLEVVSNAAAKAEFRARSNPAVSRNSGAFVFMTGVDTTTQSKEIVVTPEGPELQMNSEGSDTPQPVAICGRPGDLDSSEFGLDQRRDVSAVLLNLPEPELCNLCKLLAREGLSDNAHERVTQVLKKLSIAAAPHRRLFVSELAETARRLSEPAITELETLGDPDSTVISSMSMSGSAILRVLQALSLLTSFDVSDMGNEPDVVEKEYEEGMLIIRDLNSSLEKLWLSLSKTIFKIEGILGHSSVLSPRCNPATAAIVGPAVMPPPLPPGTQKLLPFVEGFFVLCEKLCRGPAAASQAEPFSSTAQEIKEAASSSIVPEAEIVSIPRSPPVLKRKLEEKGVTFVRFADKHRRLLNAFVRTNPGLLEKSLSLMLKTPRLIDFDNKRAYFRSKVRQQHEQQHYAPLRIVVRRAYILEDSYNQLRMRTPDELKGRLTVQFQGEEGIDAGGLTREWYQLLSRVTFDKGALLFTTVGNDATFQPNPNSVYQTEHLSYFKFVGRVVAKALFDGQLLDVYFTRSFYKHILGVKVTYHDIEAIDPDYYKNLKWMLENDINDILGLTFSMDADEEKHILYEKTEVTDYELIVGGRNIRVTEENKHEYVDLVAEHRLTTAIRPQITAFLEGFNELVSGELISIFNDKELELLISGLPEIDLEDLKANTEYTGYTAASQVVQWFWEVLQTLGKEDMARLLQFITGTSKVPLEGFRALQGISGPQKFQMHKAYGAPERLPSAHTCFNQLDLPEYASKEQLLERLLLAIHEASEGFGFG